MCAIYRATLYLEKGQYTESIEAKSKSHALDTIRYMAKSAGKKNVKSALSSITITGFKSRPNKQEAVTMSTFTLNTQDLSIVAGAAKDKGTVINSAAELSKIIPLSAMQTLAKKFLDKPFEKGTKKSVAVKALYDAISEEFGVEDKKSTTTTAPDKGAKGMPKMKKEKVVKEKKEKLVKEKGPRKEKSYTFIAPGASVKPESIIDENEKKLTPQGIHLFNTFFTGTKKGQEITLAKSEIIAKIEESGYKCGGNLWSNFMWYRRIFKLAGLMA